MVMADPNRLADVCIVEVVGYHGHVASVSHGVLVYYPASTELLSGYPAWCENSLRGGIVNKDSHLWRCCRLDLAAWLSV